MPKKKAMLINGTSPFPFVGHLRGEDVDKACPGQFPGPTIKADWGDTIRVTVTNNLRVNGTSIHWHGVRMLNNNVNDG